MNKQRLKIVLILLASLLLSLNYEKISLATTKASQLITDWVGEPSVAELVTRRPTPTVGFKPIKIKVPTSFSIKPRSNIPTPAPTLTPIPTRHPEPTIPKQKPIACPTTSGENYGQIPIASAPTANPALHPDINLEIRGYSETTSTLDIINIGGDTDDKAPQLDTLFSPPRRGKFLAAYQVNHWDWSKNQRGTTITELPVTLIGIQTTPGEKIYVPISGYDIGYGNQAMVLYATAKRITLKYTREDNIVYGYTIHIEDFCVDPNLLALYNSLNSQGRTSLPAIPANKPIGYAANNELKVAIRDTGSFMDPRSRKDWWKKY